MRRSGRCRKSNDCGYKTDMGYDTYQFEADEEGGPWRRVALWDSTDPLRPTNGDAFEVGEPVYLTILLFDSLGFAKNEIWWIRSFEPSSPSFLEARCLVSTGRNGSGKSMSASVLDLEKLNAMERLAAEYAY